MIAVWLRAGATAMATLVVGTAVAAQRPDSSAQPCAGLNGIVISAAAAGRDSARDTTTSSIGGPGRTSIDTTFRFDVADRRWDWAWVRARIAAGASSAGAAASAGGSSPDPRRSWHACAGAAIGMDSAVLRLHGVHGQVHLKADLSPLAHLPGGGLADTTRSPHSRR